MASERKVKVAISGGGLAGAAVARALFRQPHLEVHIYESASEFSERGQGIGMAINAQRALGCLVDDIDDLFSRAGAVLMNSTRFMVGTGPQAGIKIHDHAEEHPGKTLNRAALLHELLEPIPPQNMHVNKKLVSIEELSAEAGLAISFADGTRQVVDCLIGADGIFGSVRSYILGSDHPATAPVAAGWAGTVNLVPFAKAEEKLGAQWFEDNRQYGWVGPNGIMIHDLNRDGKVVQCIATSVDMSSFPDRRKSVDRNYLESKFADWLDGPIGKGMIDLLVDQESPAAFTQWEHLDAPTYVRGPVCVIGDAAHAMTPWQGSGAAMALEDAVILGRLFELIKSPFEIKQLLEVYDKARRPRTQRVAQSSRLTGNLLCGNQDDVGLDPLKMRDALKDRWDYIHELDLDSHVESAIRALQQVGSPRLSNRTEMH